ncbi:3-oxoacyl-[acyl-carrier protein] reductase [Paenibacillus taihuensis]|uniref:3-oxoacyl-[acyl-carrier protein] reductase n=1 Tax=Paenibacillus taihuensis TaxID=1156355 RepID=A0A3D9S9D3_9BACL|nr:SDR family oxidoreductase [Paenibacillus taihuensis]REE85092.1 3-oxoacyl-[acyl-carrier protein] reductase [Paenibacillus taihuensis]
MGKLNGQVAVITGAGTGLGRATAIDFARVGAHVVLLGRRLGKLEETAALIESDAAVAGESKVLIVACDTSNEEAAQAAVERIIAEFGKIDILVNNAAVLEPGKVIELTAAEWALQLSVNLTGPFLMTRAVLPIMRQSRFGRIINITSGLASNGAGGYAAYSASKAGLESLTRTTADEEHDYGILVNAFNPGTIRSEMHATGKDPHQVTRALVDLASLPQNGVTGSIVVY